MAKYRLLTQEELNELEKDFINYLVVNGITADDWKKMKINEKEKAEKIINLFSDVVFEKILRTTKHIIQKTDFHVNCVQCNSEEMVLLALKTDKENDFENGSLYKGVKKYKVNRELEIFQMLQNGYEISDGKKFEELQNLIK